MSEIKVFRITGEMVKPNLKTTFRKEIRALSPENAREKIYTDLGSKHRAKRFQIRILEVEEIPPEEIQNPLIRKLTLEEKPDVE
ncbi:MAG: 50S ribosomal protein L18Ae [Candidatus Bathyarchaeota archaeon]|nr:50S ribosomal protein L18Ae [Candidatus Bathyarchaeota archaeon]